MYSWDLTVVAEKDKKIVEQWCASVVNLCECQFKIDIDTELVQDSYVIYMYIIDSLRFSDISQLKHDFRTICTDIQFNFPLKRLECTLQRLSAPMRGRRRKRIRRLF